MNVDLEISAGQFVQMMEGILRQFPFATEKALNRMALGFQKRQRAHQTRVFTIREKTYFRQAVKIPKGVGFASRKEQRYESTVLIDPKITNGVKKFDIFRRQEYGEKPRTPTQGRKRLTLPTEQTPRKQNDVVRRTARPLRLKRTFVVPGKKAGTLLMFTRLSKQSKKYVGGLGRFSRSSLRRDPNVRFMYYLIKQAPVDAEYDFFENARKVYITWPRVFNSELQKAFANARPARRRF